VHLSPSWSRMMGGPLVETTIPVTELFGRVPEEERAMCTSGVMAVFQQRSVIYDVEHRVRRDDGSYLWIRSRGGVSARSPDGRALRMTGTNFDITPRKLAELALRESESKLRLVTDNIPLMITHLDTDLRFLFANQRYLDFFRVELAQLLGRRLSEVAGEMAESVVHARMAELRSGQSVVIDRDRRDRGGRLRSYEIQLVPQLDASGSFAGVFTLIDDVTERREAQRELATSAAELRLITDGVSSMITHMDLEGRLLFANRRFREFYGLGDRAIAGIRVADVVGLPAWENFAANLAELRAGREVTYDREAVVEGQTRHLEVRLVPHRGASGAVASVYGILNDVTSRVVATKLLEQQALSDPLTGLPNKRLLLDRLDRALAQARRNAGGVAALFVDLDGFKEVNDQYGHAGGDVVLRQVAARLLTCVRSADTVARVGGDEFVVVLEACRSTDDAESVAGKLVAGLAVPFELASGAATISCSVGIAMHPLDGEIAETLLRKADEAMYRAKQAGKNRFARCAY